MTLVAHRGGWEATVGDLASVPVPDATESYCPVPYPRLVEELKLHIPRFGLNVQAEQYALARAGNQLFGVLTCRNGQLKDYALAIGIRSSYDRSLAVELVAGSRVFVCDNLAFNGEAGVHRKHTVNVFRDLPDLIYRMLQQVSVMKARQENEIEEMRHFRMEEPLAHHLMVAAVRRNALPASKLPRVIEEWDHPRHEEFNPRNAWSLFNCFTEVMKGRSPADQMDGTLRLSRTFREVLAL
jgi:hypothetical protein